MAKKIPSQEDRVFIRGIVEGEKKTAAFKKAYPNHPKVKRYMDIISKQAEPETPEEPQLLRQTINRLAKDKTQAKYIRERIVAFADSMDVLASKSLLVANELLDNGRSEKVRADLAMEFIRHKVGTPVQKVQAQVDKTVRLEFGTPAARDNLDDIIEAEVVE